MGKNDSNPGQAVTSSKDHQARIVAWISICLVIISLFVSFRQCTISENLAHLNVRPNIKSYIRGHWPDYYLVFYNDGEIEAINLMIRKTEVAVEKTFVEGKKSPIITMSENEEKDFDPKKEIWINYSEFKPNDSAKRIITPEFKGSKWTRIYKIDISYYRESDMENFNKTVLYFADEDSIYNQNQYRSKNYYSIIMKHYFRYLEKEDEHNKFLRKFDNIIPEQ